MSEIKWTADQRKAIDSNGYVLVSAAAGSGKTAVLVERVIEKITGEKHCNIDELLIVTFTKAAARQMKEKLSKKLTQMLIKDPENLHLRRQQVLLDKANISTMDSFFSDVVKNNFQHLENLDLLVNFSVLDDSEFKAISAEAVDEVIEEKLNENDLDFKKFISYFVSGKDSRILYKLFEDVHKYISSIPEPFEWLDKVKNMYSAEMVEETPWGEYLFGYINRFASVSQKIVLEALERAKADEYMLDALGEILENDLRIYTDLIDICVNKKWDELYNISKNFNFLPWTRKSKNIDKELKNSIKSQRDFAKKLTEDALKTIICSNNLFKSDMQTIHPVVIGLAEAQKAYETKLLEMKEERQKYEFSDIAFFALEILIKDGKPTDVAKEYAEKFSEILVDEYQDTNGVQDAIFSAISKNNLFLVGDVKQSIYSFRQAEPEIFVGRRGSLKPYTEGDDGGCIYLKNNFRSRSGITCFVNDLFKNIMSSSVGGVDYTSDEYLEASAEHIEDESVATEIHILENYSSNTMGEKVHDCYYEGRYLASYIKEKVENGEQIADGENFRNIRYGDFCILLRGMTHSGEYTKAFEEVGVPIFGGKGEKLFDSAEVKLVMSFLKAIDNPLRDTDLLTVMCSEIFGFTADELALIRAGDNKRTLYFSVSEKAKKGNEKCKYLVDEIERYRTLSSALDQSDFLSRFYEETNLPEILGAGENGQAKRANLMSFLDEVKSFESGGYFGLTSLIRYLDKICEQDSSKDSAYTPLADDKVSMLTVHHSKGLEYPVVIFANAGSDGKNNTDSVVFNKKFGVGLKVKDETLNSVFNTIPYSAVSKANKLNEISEEIRVLYVALTRPREKLIISGVVSNKNKDFGKGNGPRNQLIRKISCIAENEISGESIIANNNFLKWILIYVLGVRGIDLDFESTNEPLICKTSFSTQFSISMPNFVIEPVLEKKEEEKCKADNSLKESILQNFDFKYKYSGIEKVESKVTPSSVNESYSWSDMFEFKKPDFMETQKYSATSVGTLTHKFLEKLSSFSAFNFEKECAKMIENKFMSKEQTEAVDKKAIEKFFSSDLAQRMKNSDRLLREYEISYLEDTEYFYKDLPENLKSEKIFVDGMVDAVFFENGEAVIVDYKTDKVKSADQLAHKYSKQIEIYSRAIAKIFNCKVKGCYLYSFSLGEEVKVDF